MLSDDIKSKIQKVASDPQVQMTCILAMFRGCKPDTDLWEWLESESEKFKPETQLLLWGEGREKFDEEALYNAPSGNEVIEYLLDDVGSNICNTILIYEEWYDSQRYRLTENLNKKHE